MRKMAGKARLVERHVLDPDQILIRLVIKHLVNQQKRIPVRQVSQYIMDIHSIGSRGVQRGRGFSHCRSHLVLSPTASPAAASGAPDHPVAGNVRRFCASYGCPEV